MGPTGFWVEFAVAAAVGGLIGIEREHREDQQEVLAGVRTFPLIGLAGFLTAFLGLEAQTPFVLMAGVAGAFLFAVTFSVVRSGTGQRGATTPIAMVVTFLLGVIVGYGYTFEAVVIGVVTTFLLVTKRRLHHFARVLDDAEILSALQFITLLFIALPLSATLDGAAYGIAWLGRGALIDPYVILLAVVFVSSVSFVSLVAMRQVGPRRGLEVSGLLGGLVNSEATTAGLAQRAKDESGLLLPAVVASVLASTTMLARNLAIVAFTDPSLRLFTSLLPYIVPIFVVGLALAWWLRRRAKGEYVPPVRVKNPFAIWPALRFATIFALVSVASNLAIRVMGESGVYVTSLGGFVSGGAVLASIASLVATGNLAFGVGLKTCLLAFTFSVAGKLFIFRAVNPDMIPPAIRPFSILTGLCLVATTVAFLVV